MNFKELRMLCWIKTHNRKQTDSKYSCRKLETCSSAVK